MARQGRGRLSVSDFAASGRDGIQYWQDARGWVTAPGKRRVYVGGDERAAALAATVTIPR